MSRQILEASLRAFVSQGSGIAIGRVIEGQHSDPAPEGLYSSLHLISEHRIGRDSRFQHIGETQSFVVDGIFVEAMYSLEFYRLGALNAAFKFSDWAMSETGISWAAHALTDGRIKGANVYAGGTGYSNNEVVTFKPISNTPVEDNPTQEATGLIRVNATGSIERVTMTELGEGYYDPPDASIASSGTGAVISPRGFGFDIKHPIVVRNLTGMIADDFEERAQIDLHICHTRTYVDNESGRITQIIEDSQ